MPDNQGYMVAAYVVLGVLYVGYAAWSMRPAARVARPPGVALTAIYTALGGAAGNVFAGGVLSVADLSPTGRALGIALVILGLLALAVTYGLWVLTPWGWSLARAWYGVSIPSALVSMVFDASPGNMIRQVIALVLAVVILVYLSKPAIKVLFRPS